MTQNENMPTARVGVGMSFDVKRQIIKVKSSCYMGCGMVSSMIKPIIQNKSK